MQLSNYHSHCLFCDGRSTPENFIRFAIAHKFRAYGFSSHSPLPFETNWNMSKDDMPEYLAEIERLKHKYKEQLEIYVGLEIDFKLTSWTRLTTLPSPISTSYRSITASVRCISCPLSCRLPSGTWSVSTDHSMNSSIPSTYTTAVRFANWFPTILPPFSK